MSLGSDEQHAATVGTADPNVPQGVPPDRLVSSIFTGSMTLFEDKKPACRLGSW